MRLFSSMARIGLMGFGGGNALVPVIEHEVVDSSGLVDKDEFDKEVVVANLTPGALPVSIASGVGAKAAGSVGMVVAAVGMGLPGAMLTLALLALFSTSSRAVANQVRIASIGVSMLIVFVLAGYVRGAVQVRQGRQRVVAAGLVVGVFALTCGRRLQALLSLQVAPLVSLSTLDVLVLLFFVIFFTRGRILGAGASRVRTALSAAFCTAYVLASNEVGVLGGASVLMGVRVGMAVLALWGFSQSLRTTGRRAGGFPVGRVVRRVGTWASFVALLCLPVVVCPGALNFALRGAASAFMSFGGGDAYLAVGQGVFVDAGLVAADQYFGQLATICNAMPGSIMCKMLAGVGYLVGGSYGTASAILVALAGFGVAVGMSGMGFQLIHAVYDEFESLDCFCAIKRYIRPVIGGLLLTIVVQLFSSNVAVAGEVGLPATLVWGLSLAVLAVVAYLGDVRKARLGGLVLVAAALALAVGNLALVL